MPPGAEKGPATAGGDGALATAAIYARWDGYGECSGGFRALLATAGPSLLGIDVSALPPVASSWPGAFVPASAGNLEAVLKVRDPGGSS